MDGLEITKPLAPVAPATTDVPSVESALCCAAASSIQPPGGVLRSWIGNRRVLAVAGLGVTGGGIAIGWDWLTTVGIAPLIVSAAPCLIMCALGLCMMGRGRQASDISNREAE
jgi:hypothetical protein